MRPDHDHAGRVRGNDATDLARRIARPQHDAARPPRACDGSGQARHGRLRAAPHPGSSSGALVERIVDVQQHHLFVEAVRQRRREIEPGQFVEKSVAIRIGHLAHWALRAVQCAPNLRMVDRAGTCRFPRRRASRDSESLSRRFPRCDVSPPARASRRRAADPMRRTRAGAIRHGSRHGRCSPCCFDGRNETRRIEAWRCWTLEDLLPRRRSRRDRRECLRGPRSGCRRAASERWSFSTEPHAVRHRDGPRPRRPRAGDQPGSGNDLGARHAERTVHEIRDDASLEDACEAMRHALPPARGRRRAATSGRHREPRRRAGGHGRTMHAVTSLLSRAPARSRQRSARLLRENSKSCVT